MLEWEERGEHPLRGKEEREGEGLCEEKTGGGDGEQLLGCKLINTLIN